VSNHVIIRLIIFVSRFTVHLCNAIYFLTTFSTPCKWFTKFLHFAFWDLNKARKQRGNDGGKACLRATGNMVEFLWAFWCIFWFGEVDEGEMVLSHGHFVNNFLVSHNIVDLFLFLCVFCAIGCEAHRLFQWCRKHPLQESADLPCVRSTRQRLCRAQSTAKLPRRPGMTANTLFIVCLIYCTRQNVGHKANYEYPIVIDNIS